MIIPPFNLADALLVSAFITTPPQEPAVAQSEAQTAPVITTRDVALRLFDEGYMRDTLPRREEDFTLAILKAYEGKGTRYGDLPARRSDLAAIRDELGLIEQEVQRYERSLECDRYRPAFVKPVGRL